MPWSPPAPPEPSPCGRRCAWPSPRSADVHRVEAASAGRQRLGRRGRVQVSEDQLGALGHPPGSRPVPRSPSRLGSRVRSARRGASAPMRAQHVAAASGMGVSACPCSAASSSTRSPRRCSWSPRICSSIPARVLRRSSTTLAGVASRISPIANSGRPAPSSHRIRPARPHARGCSRAKRPASPARRAADRTVVAHCPDGRPGQRGKPSHPHEHSAACDVASHSSSETS